MKGLITTWLELDQSKPLNSELERIQKGLQATTKMLRKLSDGEEGLSQLADVEPRLQALLG